MGVWLGSAAAVGLEHAGGVGLRGPDGAVHRRELHPHRRVVAVHTPKKVLFCTRFRAIVFMHDLVHW